MADQPDMLFRIITDSLPQLPEKMAGSLLKNYRPSMVH